MYLRTPEFSKWCTLDGLSVTLVQEGGTWVATYHL